MVNMGFQEISRDIKGSQEISRDLNFWACFYAEHLIKGKNVFTSPEQSINRIPSNPNPKNFCTDIPSTYPCLNTSINISLRSSGICSFLARRLPLFRPLFLPILPHYQTDRNHTCKKRVMLRRRLFWPKKIGGKSAQIATKCKS